MVRGRKSFPKRHQRKAALTQVAGLTQEQLSARMRKVAAGHQWTAEERAALGKRLAAARAAKRQLRVG